MVYARGEARPPKPLIFQGHFSTLKVSINLHFDRSVNLRGYQRSRQITIGDPGASHEAILSMRHLDNVDMSKCVGRDGKIDYRFL